MSELFPDRVAYCKGLHSTVNSLFFIFGSHDGVLPLATYAFIYALHLYRKYCYGVVVDEAAHKLVCDSSGLRPKELPANN
jgi:hypothetical protein